jgi:glycosyltransferase involved in cell wall biosynthesis
VTGSRLRIAILGTRGIPARYGGFETFADELSRRLADDHEFDITVFCPASNDVPAPSTLGAVNLEYVREYRLGPFTTIASDVAAIFRTASTFDIVYMLGYGSSFACFVPRLFGTTVWINPDGIEWKRSKWNWVGRSYLRLMETLAPVVANRLICDATAIRDHFVHAFNFPVEYSVIPYGVEIPPPEASSRALLPKPLSPQDYHLVVARLEPENHVLEIIDGFQKSGSPVPLVVVGNTTPATSYIKRLLGFAHERVLFVGGIYDRAVLTSVRLNARSYLHGHSVGGTNPSLLEAMACGNVIIAHDNPFNREVAGDFATYFRTAADLAELVDQADAVTAAERGRISSECRARVRAHYDWTRVTEAYSALARADVRGK